MFSGGPVLWFFQPHPSPFSATTSSSMWTDSTTTTPRGSTS